MICFDTLIVIVIGFFAVGTVDFVTHLGNWKMIYASSNTCSPSDRCYVDIWVDIRCYEQIKFVLGILMCN